MEKFKISDDILDFAIENEIKAYKLYTNLAAKMDNPEMAGVFEKFAVEEKDHRKQLEDIKKSKTFHVNDKQVADLKIANYTVAVEPTGDMNYQATLVLAMKKEKKAFLLYTNLAALAEDVTIKQLFQSLAQQEAKHKLRFELEYDEVILKDN
ncbi:MAG: rubrerythrin [Planctomycetes bacterium HGW-Planctomycetes-1]|nr:MAG: rubrerythrin [Planctomycetes bacterium HGW-Planctomycetes-1]